MSDGCCNGLPPLLLLLGSYLVRRLTSVSIRVR